jgi:hypothetical protein
MTTPQSLQRFWEAVYACFDPIEPLANPRLRVPRFGAYSPVEKVVPSLRFPFGTRRILVAGGIGSGKSTELLTIAERLAPERVVVLFDLWRHMELSVKDAAAIEHLQAWELIGLVGLAVLRAGTERFGHKWNGTDKALARALSAPSGGGAQLDVAKLATGLAVTVGGIIGNAVGGPVGGAASAAVTDTGLEMLKAMGDAWTWQIGLSTARRRSDQDESVRGVVAATSAIIESLTTGLAGRKLVIIIDGLDRVQQKEGFERLFVESDLLRSLPCDVVVSAHLAMVQRYSGRLRFDRRYDLANEPVADRGDPWKTGPGIQFFRQLVDRRFQALQGVEIPHDVLPSPLLERLAWCSGGRPRDFMGFIQHIAERGYANRSAQVDSKLVESVVDEARRRASDGLTNDQIELLEGLVRDPDHRLPGSEVALGLLEQQLILPYPNEDAWYLPHPLLMITLIRPGSNESETSST